MSSTRDELVALVVGGVDFGDSDRIIHVLTRTGRASLFAHAAKKSKKRFAGALEPFATIRLTQSERASRRAQTLATIDSATVLCARLGIREDLGRIALASYVVELASRFAPEGQSCDELFDLATRALDALLAQPACVSWRRVFEIELLALLGYRPEVSACARCGCVDAPTFFDVAAGGRSCALHRGDAREVGPKTLEWLEEILHPTGRAPFPDDWADRAARAVGLSIDRFLLGLLEKPLVSRRLIDDLGL